MNSLILLFADYKLSTKTNNNLLDIEQIIAEVNN